ncbi:hypothetical protein HQ865_09025 [Mucilaginibacter mali]|uniref:Uncharacterized protein n=1 Tax=Mucilaginibacter mali TaxID=2740462 RepID=A0A7D4QJQ6_9SPHI|nr:hypothetical protein [Mucilaginibacter mali]QKJ29890.1 hypothetical protein HQ865_09025 [Mucilaginibacter mali]
MTNQEASEYLNGLKEAINNPKEHQNALDLDAYSPISIGHAKQTPELNHFFGLDEDGPYSEFLKKGLRSLRLGFYKLCSPPIYNKSIFPGTFAADVYYYYPGPNCIKLIKYRANIGPMINSHFKYLPVPGTPQYKSISDIPFLKEFEEQKYTIGTPDDHYYVPKQNFFKALLDNEKIFFVKESIFDPSFPHANPKPKRITWTFID